MKRTLIVLFALLCMGVFANSAFAATDPLGGYIEVCKAPSSTLTGNFAFSVTDASGAVTSVTIPISSTVTSCTGPIAVDTGMATVTELGSLSGLTSTGAVSTAPTTAFTSATVSAVGPTGPLTCGTTAFSCAVLVPASPNGSSNVVTVTFTDTLVTGVVEVCKNLVSGSGLTGGSWNFTVTGGNGFTDTVGVTASSCSDPITVPAGLVKVQETGDLAENVTQITATQNSGTTNAVVGPDAGPSADLPTATVVASVAAGDVSDQTLVSMWNDGVTLKLCKVAADGVTPSPTPAYTFALAGTVAAGAPAVPGSVTLGSGSAAAPYCTVLGPFRAGTEVTITEALTPGQKVGSITVSPPVIPGQTVSPIVGGSLNLPNRTVEVVLGAGETDVTYTDIAALDGSVKICKFGGTPSAPVGTEFQFTVTPVAPAKGSAVTVMVPIGGCTVVGTGFSYDETVSIAETPVVGESVTAIGLPAGAPTSVQVLEGGSGTPPAYFTSCPTPPGTDSTSTGQTVLSNTVTTPFTPTTTASTLTDVTISECNTTEVDVTNTDPPVTSQPPTTSQPPSSGGSGGGSSSSGGGGGSSSTGSATPTSSTTSPTTSLVSTPTGVAAAVGVTNSTTSNTTNAVKLAADKKALAVLNATLANQQSTWSGATGVNNALARYTAHLKALAASLELKLTATSPLRVTLKDKIAKINGDLPMLLAKYAKAISANQALAKEIAAAKTTQARIVAEIAVLQE